MAALVAASAARLGRVSAMGRAAGVAGRCAVGGLASASGPKERTYLPNKRTYLVYTLVFGVRLEALEIRG